MHQIEGTDVRVLLQSVSSFSGTSLPKLLWHTKPGTERHKSRGVARAAKPVKVPVEKSCQVGDHFLDNVSNYIFHQIQRPFANYIPDDWDPLDFLPVNIQSSLQKSEALVSVSQPRPSLFFSLFLGVTGISGLPQCLLAIKTLLLVSR